MGTRRCGQFWSSTGVSGGLSVSEHQALLGFDLPEPAPKAKKGGGKVTRELQAEWAGVSKRTVIRWAKIEGFPKGAKRDELLLWLGTQPDIRLNDTTAQRIAEAKARLDGESPDDSPDDDEEAAMDAQSSPAAISRLNSLREEKLEHEIAKLKTQISKYRRAIAEEAVELITEPIVEALVDIQKTLTGFKLPLDQQKTINGVVDYHIERIKKLISELDLV